MLVNLHTIPHNTAATQWIQDLKPGRESATDIKFEAFEIDGDPEDEATGTIHKATYHIMQMSLRHRLKRRKRLT